MPATTLLGRNACFKRSVLNTRPAHVHSPSKRCTRLSPVHACANARRPAGGAFFNLFNLGKTDAEMKKLKLNEIKNGRLAMLAMLGYGAQATITRDGPFQVRGRAVQGGCHLGLMEADSQAPLYAQTSAVRMLTYGPGAASVACTSMYVDCSPLAALPRLCARPHAFRARRPLPRRTCWTTWLTRSTTTS